MLFQRLHPLIAALYAVAPLVAAALAIRRARRVRNPAPMIVFWLTVLMGAVLGSLLLFLNMAANGLPIAYTDAVGRQRWDLGIRPLDATLFLWFVVSALFITKLLDRLLVRLVFWLIRVRVDPLGRVVRRCKWRAAGGMVLQRLALLALLIPYMTAAIVIYRPKFDQSRWATLRGYELSYREGVSFTASDGVELRGWWVPAEAAVDRSNPEARAMWGVQTVIVCPGLCSCKEQQIPLIQPLVRNGFNVLVFDMRAQGQSDGHVTTFGDLERRDVLAAVAWIRQTHKAQAQKLFAIGTDTGAAAIVAAVGNPLELRRVGDEPSEHLFDAIVLIEPYADFTALSTQLAHRAYPGPAAWLVDKMGLAVGDVHAGAGLGSFSPANYVDQTWPWPVLVVHGDGQGFVPYGQGMQVFAAAVQPKEDYWPVVDYEHRRRAASGSVMELFVPMVRQVLGTGQAILRDRGVHDRIVRFLRSAREAPVL